MTTTSRLMWDNTLITTAASAALILVTLGIGFAALLLITWFPSEKLPPLHQYAFTFAAIMKVVLLFVYIQLAEIV